MKILVCGGRDWRDQAAVDRVLTLVHARKGITQIIEGGAAGADRMARNWAQRNGVAIKTFEADWSLGRRAGPLRNARMLAEGKPDGVIAFPGGAGTADMMRQAERAGVKVWRPVGYVANFGETQFSC